MSRCPFDAIPAKPGADLRRVPPRRANLEPARHHHPSLAILRPSARVAGARPSGRNPGCARRASDLITQGTRPRSLAIRIPMRRPEGDQARFAPASGPNARTPLRDRGTRLTATEPRIVPSLGNGAAAPTRQDGPKSRFYPRLADCRTCPKNKMGEMGPTFATERPLTKALDSAPNEPDLPPGETPHIDRDPVPDGNGSDAGAERTQFCAMAGAERT